MRGDFCGLLSMRFLSEMLSLKYWTTWRVLQKWLKVINKKPKDLDARDLWNLVEFVYEKRYGCNCRHKNQESEIEDFIEL